RPTVGVDVIALVASSCGYTRGESAPRVAQSCTAYVATQRGRAARPQQRQLPRAQPVALMREHHGSRPRLTPRRCTAQAPRREQGHPGGRTREEKRPRRSPCLMMRCLPASPLFASWPWPRHHWMLVGSSCYDTYQRNRERGRQEVYTRLKNQSLILTKLLSK